MTLTKTALRTWHVMYDRDNITCWQRTSYSRARLESFFLKSMSILLFDNPGNEWFETSK